MKVLALLPSNFNDRTGAILEVSPQELAMLLHGNIYTATRGIQPGAQIQICERVEKIGKFEERMRDGKEVGNVLRSLAEVIDAAIVGAEGALIEPKIEPKTDEAGQAH